MAKQVFPAEIGRVVQSTAGRDSDRFFIIVDIAESDYVLIADGKHHKLLEPKKKKLKHLKLTEDVLNGIAEKLRAGTKVFDKEVHSALRKYNEETGGNGQGR